MICNFLLLFAFANAFWDQDDVGRILEIGENTEYRENNMN